MNIQILNELETLTHKIENNTATLDDYKRYEVLLLNGGLSHDYIFSYLDRAGFKNWDEFVTVRQNKEKNQQIEAVVIGGLVGLGLALLIVALLSGGKK